MSAQHPLDVALELTERDGSLWGATSAAYANMIGPFGGVTAAAMLKAVLEHPEADGDPVSFTVNFAAAVADGDFELDATPMRLSRSTQHWFVTMSQGDAVVTTATAVLAVRKETWRSTEATFRPVPDDVPVFDNTFMPPWANNYAFRFAEGMDGMLGGQPQESSVTLQAVRDDPPRPLDFPALTALCDIFVPRVFVRRVEIVPIGTVSMTIHFHADSETVAAVGTDELVGEARGTVFNDRYFEQTAELWTESGTPLATTTQLVYFKA